MHSMDKKTESASELLLEVLLVYTMDSLWDKELAPWLDAMMECL